MFKIFRVFFIVPDILVLGMIGLFLYLFKDSSLKSYLQSNVEGLNISTLETTLKAGELQFNLSGDYLDTQKQTKLLEITSISGSMDFYALGFGSVIIPHMQIDNLVIQPELFQMASADNTTTSSTNTTNDKSEESLIPDFDLENFDRREWLERFTGERELASEKHISSIQQRAKKLKDQWDGIDQKEKLEVQTMIDQGQSMIKDWEKNEDLNNIKQKIDSLKKNYESLKGQNVDKNNITGLMQNLEKIKHLKQETDSIQSLIKDTQTAFKGKLSYLDDVQAKAKTIAALPKQLSSDIEGFQQDLKSLPGSIKQDQELLKKELDFKNFDTTKLTRLFFGKEFSDELKPYLDIWYKIQAYLPASGNAVTATVQETTASSQEAKPITYLRNQPLPDWALKHLSYTGRSRTTEDEPISFQGNLNHISSNESEHGSSPSFDLFGQIAGTKGGTFNIVAGYSSLSELASKRYLKLNLKGRKLQNKIMGKGSTQIEVEQGLMSTIVNIDLSKTPYMRGDISIQLENAKFKTGDKVKPMVSSALIQALDKTFTQPLVLNFEYQQDWPAPKIEVDQRLDEVFKEATSSLVSSFAKEQQDKLLQDFSQKMSGQSSDILKQVDLSSLLNGNTSESLNALSNNLLSSLGQWTKSKDSRAKEVSQQQDLLNQLINSLGHDSNSLGQQQNDLKDQAKKTLGDNLKDKLLGGLKTKEEDPSQPTTEEKKPANELKSIEKAFKGLF